MVEVKKLFCEEWYLSVIKHHTTDFGGTSQSINWCDVIATTRGWHPLTLGETMTVSAQGKTYEIKRVE